jgi:hypothetical protein
MRSVFEIFEQFVLDGINKGMIFDPNLGTFCGIARRDPTL